jgi:bifunctional DNase/RNase
MTPATAVGYLEMRIAKVVGLAADDELFDYVVLDEVAGDRQLAIEIGQPEAFSLAARLGGLTWPRPMTYQFVAALVHALGGRVRQVQIDRVVEEAYVATVEVDGPSGVQPVDARPSDALNLAALVQPRSSSPSRCWRPRPEERVIPPEQLVCVGRWSRRR